VVTKGGILPKTVIPPLIKPAVIPTAIPSIIENVIDKPCLDIIPAQIVPDKAAMEPTDRSIPAVNITMVMPIVMIATKEDCKATLERLDNVKNLSEVVDNMITTSSKMKKLLALWNHVRSLFCRL